MTSRFLKTFLVFGFAVCMSLFQLNAQVIEPSGDFLKGRLDNGLTYYIIHNENPAGCADFYIAHNVGALEENDDQDGLAHFLEHLAFNGLKHFPDKEMLNYLSRNGVRFGYNVNAYTSRTETVYNIDSVPVAREALVDSVLLILRDWADGISCETEAVKAESGVINEEWRLRAADQRARMARAQDALIYEGSKQARRTVLGNMDVINSATGETLLNFYHSWYRPDLQALVIVGDIDAAKIESKIKTLFADLKSPASAKEKEDYTPAPRTEDRFSILTDPDIKFTVGKIIHTLPLPKASERSKVESIREELVLQCLNTVLSTRLKSLVKEEHSPLASAVCVTNQSGRNMYVNMLTLSPRPGVGLYDIFVPCQVEIERLLRHGISDDELANARFEIFKRYKFNNIDTSETNGNLVKVCLNNFLLGLPLIHTYEYQEIQSEILSSITKEEIETYAERMFNSPGIYASVVSSSQTEKAVPETDLRSMLDSVKTVSIEPKYCTFNNMNLDVTLPEGKIVAESKVRGGNKTPIRRWKLSNGAEVYFMACDTLKKSSRIKIDYVFENGGFGSMNLENPAKAKFTLGFIKRYLGMRGIDRANMGQQPALLGVSDLIYFRRDRSSLELFASDVENAFKVGAIQLTEPYFGSKAVYDKEVRRTLKDLAEPVQPKSEFSDSLNKILMPYSPFRGVRLDTTSVKSVDMAYIEACFSHLFGDISSMKVFIVSDAPEAQIKDYVCKYVASLPASETAPKTAVRKSTTPQVFESQTVDFKAPLRDVPLSIISYNAVAKTKVSDKTDVAIEILDYIMTERCMNQIREERGGTYSVTFKTESYPDIKSGKKLREQVLVSGIDFQTRVVLRDILLQDSIDLLAQMANEGPTEKEVDEARKYFTKKYNMKMPQMKLSSGFWADRMEDLLLDGRSWNDDYLSILDKITVKDIQSLAALIESGYKITGIYSEE